MNASFSYEEAQLEAAILSRWLQIDDNATILVGVDDLSRKPLPVSA